MLVVKLLFEWGKGDVFWISIWDLVYFIVNVILEDGWLYWEYE